MTTHIRLRVQRLISRRKLIRRRMKLRQFLRGLLARQQTRLAAQRLHLGIEFAVVLARLLQAGLRLRQMLVDLGNALLDAITRA